MEAVAQSPTISPATSVQRQAQDTGRPELLLSLGATSIVVGILWDISWHISIGRDTFWTPAHMAIYLGGLMGGCVGGWLAFKHTFLHRQAKLPRRCKCLACGRRSALVWRFGGG